MANAIPNKQDPYILKAIRKFCLWEMARISLAARIPSKRPWREVRIRLEPDIVRLEEISTYVNVPPGSMRAGKAVIPDEGT